MQIYGINTIEIIIQFYMYMDKSSMATNIYFILSFELVTYIKCSIPDCKFSCKAMAKAVITKNFPSITCYNYTNRWFVNV